MSDYVDIEPEPATDAQAIADEVHQAKLRRMLGRARADGRIDLLALEHQELVRLIGVLRGASLQETPDLDSLLTPLDEKDPDYGSACGALRSLVSTMVNREIDLDLIQSRDLTWMLELAGTKSPPADRGLLLVAASKMFRGEPKEEVDPLEVSEALEDHMRKARLGKNSSTTIHTSAAQYRATQVALAKMALDPLPDCPDHPCAFYVTELHGGLAPVVEDLVAELKVVAAQDDAVKYLRRNPRVNVLLSSCDKKADDLKTNCLGPISSLKKAITTNPVGFVASTRALAQLQGLEKRAGGLREDVTKIREYLRVLGKRPTA